MGVSFETWLRRRGDALMGRRCYNFLRHHHDVPIRCRGDMPLRRLGDVPRRRRCVFHLRRNCDFAGTYRETSLRRRYDVLLPGGYITYIDLESLMKNNRWMYTQSRKIFNNKNETYSLQIFYVNYLSI